MAFSVGRVCVKIAGRDAGQYCVVVDVLEGNMVLVDGATRRRKCNVAHLEPIATEVSVKKGASTNDVIKALNDAGFAVEQKKEASAERIKARQAKADRPKRVPTKKEGAPAVNKEAAPKTESKKEAKAAPAKKETAKKK